MGCKLASNDYIERLRSWNMLRASLENKDAQTICEEVNNYWANLKTERYYLHPVDIEDWPTPWELIHDNTYCVYAKALGIIYTLLLLGIEDIDFVEITHDNNENIPVVLVDNAKYVLNLQDYEPVNSFSSNFTIIKKYSIRPLKQKAGII